jgi:hypothetical protein
LLKVNEPPDPSQLFSLWRLNCFGLDQLAAAHDRPIELRSETLSVMEAIPTEESLGFSNGKHSMTSGICCAGMI